MPLCSEAPHKSVQKCKGNKQLCFASQVNLKLFTPAPNRRKTVLLFVFRDMTRTPLQQLQATWEEDLQRMWASITKPPHYDAYSFYDFFEVPWHI